MLALAQGAAAQEAATQEAGAALSGEAARGAGLIRDSEKGNCTICHAIPGLGIPEEAQGNIGPPLAGVGAWRDRDWLIAFITDPRPARPDTVMPAFGTTEGLIDVAPAYAGRPILTGDEIGAIASYLETLR